MIAVGCRGRLGNQMFQYAFGLAASQLLDTHVSIDETELARLFLLGCDRVRRGPDPERIVQTGNDDYRDPEEVLTRLEDGTTHIGFFQSERFFASAEEDVRASFQVRPELVDAFRARYGELIQRDYICCHMRRTDYHTFAGGAALPMAYYSAALARLSPAPETPIVFVGDDLGEAEKAFADLPGARFEHNDAALDHQLLRNAAWMVISNSTFAWWGAWLGERDHAEVVAPRFWLGFDFGWEYPPSIIPMRWRTERVPLPWRRRLAPARMRMSLGRKRREAARRLGRSS